MFFGDFVLRPRGNDWSIDLEVRSRLTERGASSTVLTIGPMTRARVVRETLQYIAWRGARASAAATER
jgi:hypothetical protein